MKSRKKQCFLKLILNVQVVCYNFQPAITSSCLSKFVGATKHSASELEEQSQLQPNLTLTTQSQAPLLHSSDGAVTPNQRAPGGCMRIWLE